MTETMTSTYPSRPNPWGLSESLEQVPDRWLQNFAVYAPGLQAADVVFTSAGLPLDHTPGLEDLTRVQLPGLSGGVHHGVIPDLHDGAMYAIIDRATADEDILEAILLDPYAAAVTEREGYWWSVAMHSSFDWDGVTRPQVPMRDTVIYEAHVAGQTKLHPHIPEHLRGTYAGMAHPVMIDYLKDLGITTIELLPVHHCVSENHLVNKGLDNYWGYNTINYFSPHPRYATAESQAQGPAAVATEFKGMVKLLHQAGLEVILDVVYNHTAEEGQGGPVLCWRGLGDRAYYRWDPTGEHYDDTTGCGNALDFSNPAVVRMTLDSLRTWASDFGVDGFRFDLATTLARDEENTFSPTHPLLVAITQDPVLSKVKMITEPWDVGMGGWRTGQFPPGFCDWNDHYRDIVREFWVLGRRALVRGEQPSTLGRFADVLAGSQNIFAESGRSPLASVNFVTAHDGFTLADVVSYDHKHNEANGEDNRDGTDNNRSYNHGVEGPSDLPSVSQARMQTQRNVLATLALSLGVPMITAGDEIGRSQGGNNNAYCQDNEISWTDWSLLDTPEGKDLHDTVRLLLTIRRNFMAGQPYTYPSQSNMLWFNDEGRPMSAVEWESPQERFLQMLLSAPEGSVDGLVVFNGGLESEQFRIPDLAELATEVADGDEEHVIPVASGLPFVRELTTNVPDRPRQGGLIYPGETDTIAPFSVSMYSVQRHES
ncbi:glycogen debranching protein GlgX [Auritidibacter ignavus]|uniref:glycogen debranching protein GlgX n=1 Tax=Auritidibacter ignavus TaxID=678932 RepID=UPI002449692D|nr:glycogen debranching protein GlgX [Auritidibacter ignavus]WGH85025.1 glycogen debranching protein GlgX [Auritidibacter ignavus]